MFITCGMAMFLVSVSIWGQVSGRQWTLQECVNYALQNNISLQKSRIQKLSAVEDVKQAKADLLPSLTASTNQNMVYRPWMESGQNTVANGTVLSSVDKVYYSGSYAVNANWTVWNGNKNRNAVKQNQLLAQQAELDSAVTANSIQEQIAKLYIQILYSKEAIEVYKQTFEVSKLNEERGQAFVDVGTMSKSDLAQLTSQRAQDEYNIVSAESNLASYKLQLKQLLEITDDQSFDVAAPSASDLNALEEIPSLLTVYERALGIRPEIQNSKLAIESSDVAIKIAKAGKMPTIGISGGFGTNTTTMTNDGWGKQLKTNFDASVGATLSIPLFDNRQTKTAVNKAILQRESSILDLKDQQKTLYSTIETYWLDATTNQNKYKAACVAVESEEMSYELLSEQFCLGLKNIIELMTGKTNLLTAQQNELQSKYLTILNIQLLKFYEGF